MRVIFLLIVTLGLVLPSIVEGSGEEQVPVGPRALALGGAFTAVADGPDALYWNPAGLGLLRGSTIRFTSADLHGLGIQDNVIDLVSPFGERFGVGLEWYHSGFDDSILEDTIDRLNFGVGWRLIGGLSLGAAVKYRQLNQVFEEIEEGSGSGFGLDLGALYQAHKKLTLGVTWRDVGGSTLEFNDGTTSQPYEGMVVVGAAARVHPSVLLVTDIGRDFHAGVEAAVVRTLTLRGGWSKDLGGLGDGRFTAGLGVRWGPGVIDYTYQDHSMLEGTHHVGVNLDFTLAPQRVRIESATMEPLFASFYKSYATEEEAPGRLIVTNLDDSPVEVTISVSNPELMSQPTTRNVVLRPDVKQEIWFPLVLSRTISRQNDNQLVVFNVEMTYQTAGRNRTEKREARANLYGRGTINWSDGVGRAAAFVTPTDELVAQFTREILRVEADTEGKFLNKTASRAAQLFNGMSACGLLYTPDPENPFVSVQGKQVAVDHIQYPAELLNKRTGDCDDSTVLYASMLGNVGIRTAFLDVPGHIFLMFDTEIHLRDREFLGIDPDLFFEHEESLWIPVETTSLGEHFNVAWKKGSKLVKEWGDKDRFKIVDVLAARKQYEAAPDAARLSRDARPPRVNVDSVTTFLKQDLAELSNWRRKQIQTFYQSLSEVDRRKKLARIHYINLDFTGAQEELNGIAADDLDAAVLNNRGNLRLAVPRPDSISAAAVAEEALNHYTEALKRDEDDPGIMLNQALVLQFLQRYGEANAKFLSAVTLAQGSRIAVDLLGIHATDEDLSGPRAGVPEHQLTLAEIKEMLALAEIALPDSVKSKWTKRRPANAQDDDKRRQLVARPGARRGNDIETEKLVAILYWKNR